MSMLKMTGFAAAALIGAITALQAATTVSTVAIEDLKSEMSSTPGAQISPLAATDNAAKPADVIEELTPDAKPAAEAPKAVEQTPAASKPADVIEELTPDKPAPEAKPDAEVKPAPEPAKAEQPLIEELTPEPKKEPAPAPVVTEVKPVVEAQPVAPVAEAPVAVTPKKEVAPFGEAAPDAETKAALEAAMKTWGSTERVTTATQIAQQEDVRRKAREMDGRKAIELGDKAWRASNYKDALDQYKVAFTKLPNISSCAVLRNRAAQRMPECELQIVRALVRAGKDADAISQGNEFLAIHKDNPGLQSLMEKLTKQPTVGPDILEPDVQKSMRLGRENMVARSYGKARENFESVLGMDPDNREAMRYLKVLGELEYNNKTAEREATVRKMNAEVRDAWNPKYKVIKGKTPTEKPSTVKAENAIEEKMKNIVIDEIEFRQANMHDVVEFLNKQARASDKTTDDETKKGLNIILSLNPGATGGGSTPDAKASGKSGDKADDLFGAPAEGADKSAGSSGVPEVTFSARYITLYNALKIICNVTALRWKVEGGVVMIVPADSIDGTIEMRMYPVEPTFIERVKMASSEMPTITRVGSREKEALDNKEGVGSEVPTDLKAYFENMGVKFPKGSSITYNSAIGKVIVANTADNLASFERLLQELNVVPQQVEIEARFVEVNETDLYEAGLEWLLTDNWEMLMKGGASAYAPIQTSPRIQMTGSATDGGITKGLRFMGLDSNGKNAPQPGGKGTLGSVASFASILTNPDLTMILHALEQNGNADLLSAPKVTTRSGAEASIKVVTEFIYPTQFEVQGGQIGMNNNGQQNSASIVQETTVLPQDFATREVGVILNVLAEVSPDGNMINLTMRPQVVTEPIWYQYGSTIRRADGSEFQLNMPQPFFQVRQLETQISIYDGATVVMGGLITESVTRTNDKIPVLGDIPFIGALFRSKSEESVKKNLLIFVTAKLVDPAGQLIRRSTDQATVPGDKPAASSALMPGPAPAR